MIPDIKELNFPEYATLSQATVSQNEMGELTISTQIKIDGSIKPDFSYDWEIEFMGEKYIYPLHTPQALKDTSSINSQVDLTFQHWVVYELKRNYFVQLASVNAGTAIPDKYITPLGLSVTDFVIAFQDVLDYYYKGAIQISLNPNIEYPNNRAFINISYSYLWEVLQEFYNVYGIKWYIKGNTIYVGYPIPEVSHIFEYGYTTGLISIERQVQDADIRNSLIGRGGSTNLPKYYFKNAPEGSLYASDPDAIPELANIHFTELRSKRFRDYVQGWKTNPNRDTLNGTIAIETYNDERGRHDDAYRKGHEDERFDPDEYVRDEVSIAKYGLLNAGLDNNEEIYPSIQNISLEGIGLVNEIVAVEPVISDDIDQAVDNEAILSDVPEVQKTVGVLPQKTKLILAQCDFDVKEGYNGTLFFETGISAKKFGTYDAQIGKTQDNPDDPWFVRLEGDPEISIYNNTTGKSYNSGINLPPGWYTFGVAYKVFNTLPKGTAAGDSYYMVSVTASINNIKLNASRFTDTGEEWKPTFDIWIKNIWQTEKLGTETEEEYADRVWLPILGTEGKEAQVTFSSGWLSSSEGWEFMVVKGGYVYDTSKTFNGVPSHWRLTLQKSDAELKATDKYIPNMGMQAVAGDTFSFTGIDMQHQYVLFAEQRIFDWLYQALQKTKEIQPTWVTKFDKLRIHTLEPEDTQLLVKSLQVGALIKFRDERFTDGVITRNIQSITYNYSDKITPEVEVVLADKAMPTGNPIQKIQGEIDLLSAQIANPSSLWVNQLRSVLDAIYLRKDGVEDISMSPTRFQSIIKSGNFRSGMIGGAGWGIYKDANGNSVAEFDQIKARQSFTANSIVKNEIKHQGGDVIYSAASIEVSRVVEGEGYYDCYFDRKQGAKANLFAVDDVALSTTFDPYNNYINSYKCRVIAVGEDYIRLSSTIKMGDGVPTVGDTIIHYGNYTDANRQFVIIRSVIGGGCDRMLSDLTAINSFGKEYYFAGRKDDDSPRWFVGDYENGYAEWYDGKMTIKGEFIIDSTGEDVGTKFEATDKKIGFVSNLYNEDGSVKQGAEVVATPNGAQINVIYTKENKRIERTLGDFEIVDGNATKVTLSGDNIQLKGNLTVDGKFKVREDGSIEAKNALFYGFTQLGTLYINDDNFEEFFTLPGGTPILYASNLSPIIVFEFQSNHTTSIYQNVHVELPGYDIRTAMAGTLTREDMAYMRGFIGSTLFIYNYSSQSDCSFNFVDISGNWNTGSLNYKIEPGWFIQFQCKFEYWSTDSWQGEFIYWEIVHRGKAIPLAKS